MAERTRFVAVIAGLLLGLALSSGSASAAPPVEPPGKSGEAPGHVKEQGSAAESTPPGQAKQEDAPAAPEPQSAPAAEPAAAQAPEPTSESPRFTNASGKPKHNVPAAAEAAPEASVSAPGNSGRHKLTICHKGHAITVDVHAARAHVDGHGDTYAVAGAKGRAACPHSSGPPSTTPQSETPSGPGVIRPDVPAVVAGAERSTNHPADPAEAAAPAGGHGVSETDHEHRAAVLAGAVGGVAGGSSLPFTGASLAFLVLFGIGLVCSGLLLRFTSLGWAPERRSSS